MRIPLLERDPSCLGSMIALAALGLTIAQDPVKPGVHCMNTSKPVLGGVDMVSFTSRSLIQGQDAPVVGSARFNATLNGFTFHFESERNAATFRSDPWRYAPAWGGF